MTRIVFVVGHEDSHDYPTDTPEAYWRVLLPSKRYGTAAILGRPGATERALTGDIVWIYHPTCFAAFALAEVAKQMGKTVVVDWSEDIYRRAEQDRPYFAPRIEAAEKTMAVADMIVVAMPGLAEVYPGNVRILRTVLPLEGWARTRPPVDLAWWSDGRQKLGFEKVAPAIAQVMDKRRVNLVNIQFAHEKPLVAGLDSEDAKARAARLSAYLSGAQSQTAEQTLVKYREVFSSAVLSLECYLPGPYRESVSDVPLLRAAALGIPSLTTRTDPPSGCVSAQPEQWAEVILGLLDSTECQRLGRAARDWAERRSTYEGYDATIKEVRDAHS